MKKITFIIALALLASCSKEELTSNNSNNNNNPVTYDCNLLQKELTRKLDSVKTMGEKITILEAYRKKYPTCKF